ncbi:MAG TPA: hypothetical protein VGH70_18175 [Bradyrhizobium sp.]|jgi:hypothetical protein
MNWAWAGSLDQIWRSPEFPMWATLAAAGFFAVILLITLLRAERSVANGALTVITLLAVGIAVAATIRGYGPLGRTTTASMDRHPPVQAAMAALPALSCVDDIAGDAVAAACEKAVFASADSTAAAVNHMAQMITRLTSYGDVATVQKTMTPELQGLRKAIERDRYGLVAQVLLARDRCTPTQCPAFRSLTDNHQIITNMDEHAYDVLVSRYAAAWNMPPLPAAGAVAMLPPSPPTGRPTNAEFPSAASTPPISIMTPEPGAAGRAGASAPKPATPPPAALEAKPPAAPKKQAAKKLAAPTSITPAAAPAAATSNDDQ